MAGEIKRLAADYIKQTWTGDGSRIKEDENGNKTSESVDLGKEGTDESESVFETMQRTSDGIKGIELDDAESIWEDTDADGKINDAELAEIFHNAGVENLDDKDIALLHDIMDVDGDGVLSKEEYEVLMGKTGKITSFSLWNKFAFKADDVEAYVEQNSASIYVGTVDPNMYKNNTSYKDKMNLLLTEEQKALLEKGDRVKLDMENGISPEQMQKLVDGIIASEGKITIDDYKDILNEEDFKELKATVEEASDEDVVSVEVGSPIYFELANIIGDGVYSAEEKDAIENYLYGLENFEYDDEEVKNFLENIPTNTDDLKEALKDLGLDQTQIEEYMEKVPVDGAYNDYAKREIAKTLNERFGFNFNTDPDKGSVEDFEAFLSLLPSEKSQYAEFLKGISNSYTKGYTVGDKDVQQWKDNNIGISTNLDVYTFFGDVNSTDPDVSARLKESYAQMLVDKYGLSSEDKKILLMYGGSLAEFVSELSQSAGDGNSRITKADITAYLNKNRPSED